MRDTFLLQDANKKKHYEIKKNKTNNIKKNELKKQEQQNKMFHLQDTKARMLPPAGPSCTSCCDGGARYIYIYIYIYIYMAQDNVMAVCSPPPPPPSLPPSLPRSPTLSLSLPFPLSSFPLSLPSPSPPSPSSPPPPPSLSPIHAAVKHAGTQDRRPGVKHMARDQMTNIIKQYMLC